MSLQVRQSSIASRLGIYRGPLSRDKYLIGAFSVGLCLKLSCCVGFARLYQNKLLGACLLNNFPGLANNIIVDGADLDDGDAHLRASCLPLLEENLAGFGISEHHLGIVSSDVGPCRHRFHLLRLSGCLGLSVDSGFVKGCVGGSDSLDS